MLQSEQNTKLYRSYLCDSRNSGAKPLIRHRGKSPQQAGFFMRTGRARQEAALLASLCCLVGALPPGPAPDMEKALPTLARGELLCQAYSVYRCLIPESPISFEHAVFLLTALVRGDELMLSGCRDCSAALITDRWSLRAPRCVLCAADQSVLGGSSSLARPARGLQDWRPDDALPEFKS